MHISTQPHKSTMRLPPELAIMVISYISKKELKSLRLVCKSFDQAAIPFVFDEISIRPDSEGLANSKFCIQRFGPYIKTLIYPFVYFEDCDFATYVASVQALKPECQEARSDSHMRHNYGNYYRLSKEHLDIVQAGEDVAHLRYAFSRTPNLRKVIFTLEWPKPRKNIELNQRSQCPLEGCGLADQEHLLLYIPFSPGCHPKDQKKFSTLLTTMAVSRPTIQHLTFNPCMHLDDALPISNFNTSPIPTDPTAVVLAKLKSLHLNITTNRAHDSQKHLRGMTQFAAALSAAKNLEHLSINLGARQYNDLSPTSFKTILGDCTFPKVRSLTLLGFICTNLELLSFLQAPSSQTHQLVINFYLFFSRRSCGWKLFKHGNDEYLSLLKSVESSRLAAGSAHGGVFEKLLR